jgi:hypothetical protein
MTLTKKTILFIAILCTSFIYCQETEKVEKIKIGKYKYELYIAKTYNNELNFWILSYYIKKGSKEQYICPFLTYRENTILGKGDIDINHNTGIITSTYNNLIKNFKEDADSTKHVKKQSKQGFFEPILIVEYTNGKEKVLFRK